MAAFALLRRASERSSSANDDVAMDVMRAEVKGAWSSGRGRVGVVEWAWSNGRGRVGVVERAWSSGRGRVGVVE